MTSIDCFNFSSMGVLINSFSEKLLTNLLSHCEYLLNIFKTISVIKTPIGRKLDIFIRNNSVFILAVSVGPRFDLLVSNNCLPQLPDKSSISRMLKQVTWIKSSSLCSLDMFVLL